MLSSAYAHNRRRFAPILEVLGVQLQEAMDDKTRKKLLQGSLLIVDDVIRKIFR